MISGSLFTLFTESIAGLGLLGIIITLLLATVTGTLLINLMGFSSSLKRLPVALQAFLKKWSVPSSQARALPLIACYFYLTITILGIAYARSIGWHYALLLPRFIWFTTVLIAVGYLLIMIWLRPIHRLRVSRIVLFFSLCFNLASYWFNVGEVMNIQKSLISDFHNWRENGLLISMSPGEQFYNKYYGMILRQAIEQNIYHLPMPEFERQVVNPSIRIDANLKLVETDSVSKYAERQRDELILAKNALPLIGLGKDGAYLLLRSKEHVFIWPVDQSSRKLAHFLMNGRPAPDGNLVTVFADMLPETSYQIGVLYKINDQWKAIYSLKTFKVNRSLYLVSDK